MTLPSTVKLYCRWEGPYTIPGRNPKEIKAIKIDFPGCQNPISIRPCFPDPAHFFSHHITVDIETELPSLEMTIEQIRSLAVKAEITHGDDDDDGEDRPIDLERPGTPEFQNGQQYYLKIRSCESAVLEREQPAVSPSLATTAMPPSTFLREDEQENVMANDVHQSFFTPSQNIDKGHWGVTLVAAEGRGLRSHHAQILIEKVDDQGIYKKLIVDFRPKPLFGGGGTGGRVEGSSCYVGFSTIGKVKCKEFEGDAHIKFSGHSKTWIVDSLKVQEMLDAAKMEEVDFLAHPCLFSIFGRHSIFSKTKKVYVVANEKLQIIYKENSALLLKMFKKFKECIKLNSIPDRKKITTYGSKFGNMEYTSGSTIFSLLLSKEELECKDIKDEDKEEYRALMLWVKVCDGMREEKQASNNCCTWALKKLAIVDIKIELKGGAWFITDTRDYLIGDETQNTGVTLLEMILNVLDSQAPGIPIRQPAPSPLKDNELTGEGDRPSLQNNELTGEGDRPPLQDNELTGEGDRPLLQDNELTGEGNPPLFVVKSALSSLDVNSLPIIPISEQNTQAAKLSNLDSKAGAAFCFGQAEQIGSSLRIIGKAPLPYGIHALCESECPFFSNKKIKDTHMLVFISSDDQKLFTKRKPLNAKITCDDPLWFEEVIKQTSTRQDYWVLITKDKISYGQTFQNYEVPTTLEAAIVCLSTDITSICCKETIMDRGRKKNVDVLSIGAGKVDINLLGQSKFDRLVRRFRN
ncbi:MAG: hypothetical protein WCG42_01620 [Parachlamydiaceae bacterium]